MAYDEGVAQQLREALEEVGDEVEERRMFGGLCFMIRGNMACTASGRGGAMFRVGVEKEEAALSVPGTERMVMGGRPKPGFIHAAEAALEDEASFTRLMSLCRAHVEPMPPK